MKKFISIILALVMLGSTAVLPALASDNATYIYVAVNGNDETGDGTQANPFATINKAKEHIGVSRPSRLYDINVIIGAGTYSADTAVIMSGSSNSGGSSNDKYIRYKAKGDVTFTTAKTVKPADFKLVTESAVLENLQSQVRGKVYALDLSEYEINSTDVDLFIDDVKLTPARYPNSGYLMAPTPPKGSSITSYETIDIERAANWKNYEAARTVGSFNSTYDWGVYTITNITGTTVTFSSSVRTNAEYYVENLMEEIDYVGEYSVSGDKLYCYLPEGYNMSKIQLLEKNGNTSFIKIDDNTNYITFEGIKFDKIGSRAIYAAGEKIKNIKVDNCQFNYIKAHIAVHVSGYNMSVTNNTAYGCEGGFVTFSGGTVGSKSQNTDMTASNNLIANNYISNCGTVSGGCSYIIGSTSYNSPSSWDGISAVGAEVKNNIIANCGVKNVITVPGVNIKVQYNELYNSGRHVHDGGMVYLGRSNSRYGNEITHNYIHHLNPDRMFSGMYADDGYGGVKMNYNVFYNMSHGIHIGLGMNNEFNNNIFVDMKGRETNSSKDGRGGIFAQTRMASNGISQNSPEEVAAMVAGSKDQKSTFYYETKYAVENYGETYNSQFKDLKDALDRRPFAAPWNSQITGNLAFLKAGSTYTNGGALTSVATHAFGNTAHGNNLYETDAFFADKPGALVESGSWFNKTKTIYEIQAYGATIKDANGVDLNSTKDGNPTWDYLDSYFVDAAHQNFTLVDSVNVPNSDVESIDMSVMGLSDLSVLPANPASLSAYANYAEGSVIVSWEKPKTASKYTVKLSKTADMSNAQTIENFDNNFENACVFEGVDSDTTYYAQVTAEGIGRQNQYTLASDVMTVSTSGAIETKGLETAITMLSEEVKKANEGIYKYKDASLKAEMNAALEAANAVLANPTSQVAVTQQEIALYALIERANNTRIIVTEMKIEKCAAVDNSTMVEVTASGFEPKASVSILVTNPKTDITDFTGTTEEVVRYTSIKVADRFGKITFSFDTSVKDVDMPGEYKVYLAGSDGLSGEASYNYGTVETGAVSYKDADGKAVEATDLINYKGKTVTAVIDVTSRINSDITPAAVCGIYEGSKILSVDAQKVSLSKNRVNTVEVQITIPQTYTENSRVELMLFDSEALIKPLTTKRIMVEK